MKNNFLQFAYLLVIVSFFSCKHDRISVKEYIDYVRNVNNGLIQKSDFDAIKIEAIYKPVDLMIINDLKQETISKNEYNKLDKLYGGTQYFDIKIYVKQGVNTGLEYYGVKNYKELEKRISYLSYRLKNDIFLIEGLDTMPPSMFHFERTYGITPYNTFILAFPDNKRDNVDKIILINSEILNTDNLKLKFSYDDIQKIPRLQTN